MRNSSVWIKFISRLVILGFVFGASTSQAALVPGVTSVVKTGTVNGFHEFELYWSMISVPDALISKQACEFGIGTGDRSRATVNMSNSELPVLNICLYGSHPEFEACWVPSAIPAENNRSRLGCIGELFQQRFGSSGVAHTRINKDSPLGKDLSQMQACAAAQESVQGGMTLELGIIRGSCYNGFPTVENATCSIDTPELLLDHGSLTTDQVDNNEKTIDLNITCSPNDIKASIFTAGTAILTFNNGPVSSIITIDGNNPLRTTINGSRTFKLKSTLKKLGATAPGTFRDTTTLMINIE